MCPQVVKKVKVEPSPIGLQVLYEAAAALVDPGVDDFHEAHDFDVVFKHGAHAGGFGACCQEAVE